jgi:hypothetical protein
MAATQPPEDTMNKHSGILTLAITACLLLLASTISGAHAYGNTAQWQVGFSGNCNEPATCGPPGGGTGTFGLWGWCDFGGSNGSTAPGTTGTVGDCQMTQYARSDLGQPNNPVHEAIDITGWSVMPNTLGPGLSFHATAYTLECTGPGAELPPIPFIGCALPPNGDTGIPAAAGHYSLNPFTGFSIEIQVSQLP